MTGEEAGISGPVWLPTEPPSLAEYLAPNLQPYPVLPVIALIAALLYLTGVIRLWSQGRKWSIPATISFLAGCLTIMVVMGAGIEGYGMKMFSIFMFQQLTLMMAVPPLLVFGSPGRLLLRSMPHRGLGGTALRVALGSLRSGWARFLLHPAFMVPLFLLSFYGLYFAGLVDNLLPTWYGHMGLEILFLVAGILFTIPIISTDPLPRRQGYMGRMMDLVSEMPLHAFFGVIVMMASAPMVTFFSDMPQAWGIDPMRDQGVAGGLAWSYGELPSVLLLLLVLYRWQRDDTRTARQKDHDADRSGKDPEDLSAYNAYLEGLAKRS
ncbi:cytochrome c oxidase assembly protein [Acaricomes phytoseiuli]|uniref:cytochrome c oxidase assembly protein n=1 Tax=Acaricomes phytoseiuli TaxID=291968 RepID=UPI000371B3AD|nr:cytochrome c oxidase assembly protein [Acaricomes phytoseiuli]MCW1249677.1 cytochrome c oxidase assembly protein [Acaricomes phytoseiuli]